MQSLSLLRYYIVNVLVGINLILDPLSGTDTDKALACDFLKESLMMKYGKTYQYFQMRKSERNSHM